MRAPLHTARLALRDVTEDDAALLLELDSDPEVLRFIGPGPAGTLRDYQDRIRSVYMPWQAHAWHGLRVVLDRVGGEFHGWVFIRPATASRDAVELGWTRSDEVELGYRYRREAWGRGIATEAAAPLLSLALEDPATAAVVACASVRNAASLRVLEKLGLERVGEAELGERRDRVVKLARCTRGPSAAC